MLWRVIGLVCHSLSQSLLYLLWQPCNQYFGCLYFAKCDTYRPHLVFAQVSTFSSSSVAANVNTSALGSTLQRVTPSFFCFCFWLYVTKRINYFLGLHITHCVTKCLDLGPCLKCYAGCEKVPRSKHSAVCNEVCCPSPFLAN